MYQKEIKKNNENIIFEYIYNQKQGFSIAEIAETFHLSFPTVKRIFQNFLERGILIESQKNWKWSRKKSHGISLQ